MATKTYRCSNFGDCDLALSKEVIEIEDGEDVVCPNCKKNSLVDTEAQKTGARKGSGVKLAIAGVAVVLVIILVWALWPAKENPELANTMLSEFFPKLPK
jgi:ssDNA-binding Zn-finger/Zn-ribbon topoisomerase 1